ncbi:SDR family NAD(P)-dependent oxidoreductase [Streptomyces avidinii]|uniref:NAD(P)-dependent dehydrogenase (Short-subunit alcohol dehydrogenase family) n=1 Tax=Streptomyces avidinii TaxID=1895 RepID=A0ABS4KZR7_STRAV|nr:SDR family NAD(P)-dependent oxidoreductase [Streptomyces avidinii]MBP2035518.1 NAD(P)-dependent dehydrogenase (short-subunit alcohol dehydrogenase family) [Streptomyces avidinii]GGZ01926.1 oxidoreductase [Streptomyces avidinii]
MENEAAIRACLDLLDQARDLPLEDERRRLLEQAASDLVRDGRRRRRAARRAVRAVADAKLVAATATGAPDRIMDAALSAEAPHRSGLSVQDYVQGHGGPGAVTRRPPERVPDHDGSPGLLGRPQRCYVCKNHYRQVHHFYGQLCPGCADENFTRRTARTDLTGRRALLTGGRVKIGFHMALMLLRDGAELTVTTRFPQDAAARFAAAPGAADWWHRLRIAALDLRDPRQVLALTDHLLGRAAPLDILVNNAAQTLHRSPRAYRALVAAEAGAGAAGASITPEIWTAPGFTVPGSHAAALPLTAELAARPRVSPAVAHSRSADEGALAAEPKSDPDPDRDPQERTDEAGLLQETGTSNSWTLRLGQVEPAELLEVQLVNAVAPFLLADRLLPLLEASPHPSRYLINVSAVEGQFAARNKTAGHPHTNMAKAALNMLTRTSATDLARRGIHTCSVDTGWVTDEKPLPARERHAATGWRPPLDVIDGAARIYHPIVQGQAGSPIHGVLLKDYRHVAW